MPRLSGVEELLRTPGVRMLDVGTGVAALAVAWADAFPQLTVVGLDVLPRVLAMAAESVAASAAQDRVVLREQDVATLDEEAVYALAWLPAPFLPETALREGAVRVVRALVPGGWLMVGHGKFGGEPVDNTVSRFKTVVFGGTALDDEEAQGMLVNAGLTEVFTLPTPPGVPALTYGRKPLT
jgi:trans-aconitate methyltransferase